jgi:hypothetical protein
VTARVESGPSDLASRPCRRRLRPPDVRRLGGTNFGPKQWRLRRHAIRERAMLMGYARTAAEPCAGTTESIERRPAMTSRKADPARTPRA